MTFKANLVLLGHPGAVVLAEGEFFGRDGGPLNALVGAFMPSSEATFSALSPLAGTPCFLLVEMETRFSHLYGGVSVSKMAGPRPAEPITAATRSWPAESGLPGQARYGFFSFVARHKIGGDWKAADARQAAYFELAILKGDQVAKLAYHDWLHDIGVS